MSARDPLASNLRVRPLSDKFIRVPLAKLTEPTEGVRKIIRNAWWFVTPEDELLFFSLRQRAEYDAPQCNRDKRILEHTPIEGCQIRQIRIVYVPRRCEP